MSYLSAEGLLDLSGYVPINGNTTINNIKTFTTLPQSTVVPANNADLVNKLYCDTVVSPITIIELPLEAPAPTASGGFTYTAINNAVIPAGTWIISSHINVESVNLAGFINEWIVRIQRDNVLIAFYGGGNPAYFKTSTQITACPPFVSDGTTQLDIQIQCITSDASTWQTYVSGTDARVYITKIA